MGQKSKGKKKKRNKRNQIPAPPQRQSQPAAQVTSRRRVRAIEIVALVVGMITLVTLIELIPRLTATASLPTDPNEQLSSSAFTITNDGYARVTDVSAACFMWKIQLSAGGSTMNIERSFAIVVAPPEKILQTNEGLTVPCTTSSMFGFAAGPAKVRQADLAIVIYYRPWPFTFLHSHRLLRFVARIGNTGQIVAWDKQPAEELEPDFDSSVEENAELRRKL